MNKWMTIAAMVSASVLGISSAVADPVGGPKYDHTRVEAHTTDVYHVDCWDDEVTAIRIQGDGDTDLDLYVYDESGNLISSGTSYSDREEVQVIPYYRQTLIIKVVNRGSVYNAYTIRVW
ncbi:MAG: hypothetical protein JNL67_14385 [Planctomycetaceae bacterium]|nr:hypothetical protein [Planctomycetaceae bacterium]